RTIPCHISHFAWQSSNQVSHAILASTLSSPTAPPSSASGRRKQATSDEFFFPYSSYLPRWRRVEISHPGLLVRHALTCLDYLFYSAPISPPRRAIEPNLGSWTSVLQSLQSIQLVTDLFALPRSTGLVLVRPPMPRFGSSSS
uniref:Uncharacterized protein n=1 Tax=Aegilops tauschii subsp. strangulata TaxID=200361 RepID=A0A453RP55_AEGTS